MKKTVPSTVAGPGGSPRGETDPYPLPPLCPGNLLSTSQLRLDLSPQPPGPKASPWKTTGGGTGG